MSQNEFDGRKALHRDQ